MLMLNNRSFLYPMSAVTLAAFIVSNAVASSGSHQTIKGRNLPQSASAVSVIQTPNGGVQPQALVGRDGVLHLIYLKGDPGASDVYYVERRPGDSAFSKPIRVNSQPGSAIAAGTIRGAQLALGPDGRVHVAWNGSSEKALPRPPLGGAPMLYSRSNLTRTAFEPQRNLMTQTKDLDGGGSIAADRRGDVYVVWHGHDGSTAVPGEAGRRLWVAISRNGGNTFAPEKPATARPTGACGCCDTRAFVDSRGSVYILYRAATANIHRAITLLASNDAGRTFRVAAVHNWDINACPMSSESFAGIQGRVIGAWETRGQVYWSSIDPNTFRVSAPIPAPGNVPARKHPTLAIDSNGRMLLAWTEGTGWQKGGSLSWQVYDRTGRPLAERGRRPGAVPVWGLATACARPDGRFLVIY